MAHALIAAVQQPDRYPERRWYTHLVDKKHVAIIVIFLSPDMP